MNFQKLTPILMAKDVEATIAFYQSLLGFELVQTVPETPPFSWAQMKSGGVEVAFLEQADMQWDIPELRNSEAGGSLTFRVEMQGIDALYERVKKDDVEISLDIWEYSPGFREFRIRDCNGYFWTFIEEDIPGEKV